MAGNDVTITLTARDGASQTFKTVGRSAEDMGRQVEDAGKRAESTGARFSKFGAAAGAAFGAVSGALSDFSQAAAESEASQARLETAIDNTGHSAFEYADSLAAASAAAVQLGFDDEDAADAIAQMTTATGDAQAAIADLSIAEDIARARKISLADASRIVIAAEQGRVGSLQRIGIQIDANATREERMDALQQQFAGNAQAYAATTAGALDRVRVQFGNVEEAIGGVVNQFAPLVSLLPGLQAGWVGVSTAVGALIPEMEGAAVAASALELALGPVGLVAAGLAAVSALVLLSKTTRDEVTPAEREAQQAVADLNATLQQQLQIGSAVAPVTQEVAKTFDDIGTMVDDYTTRWNTANEALKSATAQYEYWTERQQQGLVVSKQDQKNLREATDYYNQATAALAALAAEHEKGTISQEEITAARQAANKILNDSSVAGDEARHVLAQLYEAEQDGRLGWEDYLSAVTALGDRLPQMALEMMATGDAVDYTTQRTLAGVEANKEWINSATGYRQSIARIGDGFTTLDGQVDDSTAKVTEFFNTLSGAGRGQKVLGQQFTPMDTGGLNAANTALADNARLNNDAASAAAEADAKLKDQMGAYYGLHDGLISANDAQAAFKATQDGLIAAQEPYNHQVSEYTTQLGYVDDAMTIIQQKQNDGIALSKTEQQILDGEADARARLTGGVEDATEARALEAIQYAENMKQGDEMNRLLGDQNSGTATLNTTIRDLIAALQGIPGYVSTTIDSNAADQLQLANGFNAVLDNINGKTVYSYVYVDAYGPGLQLTAPHEAMGGIIPSQAEIQRAAHGATIGGMAWVGEAGPELIYAPGARVLPHTASVERVQHQGGAGGGITITRSNFYVTASDPREFAQKMAAYRYGELR